MIPASVRIFVCTRPHDMRCSYDTLALAAQQVVGQDPRSGALFAFTNKRHNHSPISCMGLRRLVRLERKFALDWTSQIAMTGRCRTPLSTPVEIRVNLPMRLRVASASVQFLDTGMGELAYRPSAGERRRGPGRPQAGDRRERTLDASVHSGTLRSRYVRASRRRISSANSGGS